MLLSQEHDVMDWMNFAKCINECFGPPTKGNPLGELASLSKTGTVNDYTECFLAHVACAGHLDEIQQVNIYTARLLDLMFGSMLDLMTSPPTHSAWVIWCQVPASISFNVNNHISGFFVPPRVMLCFDIETSVP
jgi:hypothetical protein